MEIFIGFADGPSMMRRLNSLVKRANKHIPEGVVLRQRLIVLGRQQGLCAISPAPVPFVR